MLQFLIKYCKSDQTKQQNGCRQCCNEGNRSGPDAVTVFTMLKVMWWQRQKSSWCGSVVTEHLGPIESGMFWTVTRFNTSVLQLTWYCTIRDDGQGDAVAAADFAMVQMCSVVILFLFVLYVESGMFSYDAWCNETVPYTVNLAGFCVFSTFVQAIVPAWSVAVHPWTPLKAKISCHELSWTIFFAPFHPVTCTINIQSHTA
jgi:hypothetical protein